MAFCRLVFPVLLLCVASCYAVKTPVFLWGDLARSSSKANSLTTIREPEFRLVLEDEFSDDVIVVVFEEETLSVEDLSTKNKVGGSIYPNLRKQIERSFYLPSVENALRVVKKLAGPENSDHITLTDEDYSAKLEDGGKKFLFVDLKDAQEGESRSDMLSRHDQVMQDIVTKVQKRGNHVVALYTAHYPSWTIPITHSRARRQAVFSDGTATEYSLNGARLYVQNIFLYDSQNTTILSGYTGTSSTVNGTTMSTTMNFQDNTLVLNFAWDTMGYWSFNTVTLTQSAPLSFEEQLYPAEEINALLDFSYRCGQNVRFTSQGNGTNDHYTIIFSDLMVQPFFTLGPADNYTTPEFGDSFNCSGFFSAPIWAGLFVVFILLAITFYGIIMMMDIRSMDRFDDPKGKTININTGE